MAKKNIRSIRFSDDLAELIDRQVGNTFTEKFENLVTRCVWELPQREDELQHLEKQISMKREELIKLQKMTTQLRNNLYQINEKASLLEASINAAIKSM